jgi:ligand-binding SRPBCC domain-containing protein
MTQILLETKIAATIDICFDLSRSIDLHQISTAGTKERAIGGRTSGLICAGESVTWEAIHFGIKQNLTVQIKEMKPPHFFSDQMLKGAFKSMYHEHHFKEQNRQTLMSDLFQYETPLGFAGRIFDALILKKYMTRFLIERNNTIKTIAESGDWKSILKY